MYNIYNKNFMNLPRILHQEGLNIPVLFSSFLSKEAVRKTKELPENLDVSWGNNFSIYIINLQKEK